MSKMKNDNADHSIIYNRGWTSFDCLEAILRLRLSRAGKDFRDTCYYIYEFGPEEWADINDGKAVAKVGCYRILGGNLDDLLNLPPEAKAAKVMMMAVEIEELIGAPALPPINPEQVKSCRHLDQVAKLMMHAVKKATRETKYMKVIAPEAKNVGNLGLNGVIEATRFLFNDGNVRSIASVLSQYTHYSAIAEREVLLYRGRYPDVPSMFYHQVEDVARHLETIQWYMDGFNAQRFPCPGISRYGRK